MYFKLLVRTYTCLYYFLYDPQSLNIIWRIHDILLHVFPLRYADLYYLFSVQYANLTIFCTLFGTLIFSVHYSEIYYFLCVNRSFIIFCALFGTLIFSVWYTTLNVSCTMHKALLYFCRIQKFSLFFFRTIL